MDQIPSHIWNLLPPLADHSKCMEEISTKYEFKPTDITIQILFAYALDRVTTRDIVQDFINGFRKLRSRKQATYGDYLNISAYLEKYVSFFKKQSPNKDA